MNQGQKSAIESIVLLFDKAENKVKEVELLSQELSIPSINELRYVGYHLARALCENDEQKLDFQIDKATAHCKRAIYDAHELGIIYMLEQVKSFKEKYTIHSSIVLEVIPTYVEELSNTSKTSKFISEIKEKHRDSRDEYYEACEPHYSALRNITDRLSEAEPLINTKISEKISCENKETRRYIIAILLTILGISITATLLILKLNTSQ